MFNIVKHRDFMLADDLPTWRETEELRLQNYGHEFIVVIRADIDPDTEPKATWFYFQFCRMKPLYPTLSRRKQEFDSPRERHLRSNSAPPLLLSSFFLQLQISSVGAEQNW